MGESPVESFLFKYHLPQDLTSFPLIAMLFEGKTKSLQSLTLPVPLPSWVCDNFDPLMALPMLLEFYYPGFVTSFSHWDLVSGIDWHMAFAACLLH